LIKQGTKIIKFI